MEGDRKVGRPRKVDAAPSNADEVMPGEEEEATIPNTEEVSIPDSLFK